MGGDEFSYKVDLLAPTGALIVTVVYYIRPQPLFEILSISDSFNDW